ncbi:MAG: CoA-binding protein, partial [Streptosporangiaceae bacterium]
PEPADLAVIAVPATAELGVAEQCGQRGVWSLVVITSGLDAAACADLLAVCRRHGMRLVGPNCFGVAVPGLGLDATFAASRPRPGVAGLMSQSGGSASPWPASCPGSAWGSPRSPRWATSSAYPATTC